jgi:hypothetical protein
MNIWKKQTSVTETQPVHVEIQFSTEEVPGQNNDSTATAPLAMRPHGSDASPISEAHLQESEIPHLELHDTEVASVKVCYETQPIHDMFPRQNELVGLHHHGDLPPNVVVHHVGAAVVTGGAVIMKICWRMNTNS